MKILVLILAIFLMFLFIASDVNTTFETYTLFNAANLAKPGCKSQCGDFIVPYPFGIDNNSNCSIGHGFDLYCNTSLNPPKLSFRNSSYVSVKLISDSTLHTSNNVAVRCYDLYGNISNSFFIWENFTTWPYTISEVNKFTVLGCNDYAWLDSETKSMNMSTGCIVFCSKPEDALVDKCPGNGCCQSSIPKDISYYTTQVQSLGDRMNRMTSFNHCTYAFVGEENAFKSQGAIDLKDNSSWERIEASVPIVLEWAIGDMSCLEAEATEGFACQSNSICVNSTRESSGYRCMCKKGYHGNPYLSPGCQDIDECRDQSNYPCYGECVNTLGNFTCTCPRGYIGDARIENGCIRVHKKSKLLVTIFTSGVGLGTGLLVLAIWLYKVVQKRKDKKRREKFFKRNGGLLLQQQISNGEDAVERTRLFDATELEKATDQYNGNRIVGRGGQGTVYKGMLTDGKIVAVKKSKLVDENQVEQFINEVFLLSQISHKNVVKLYGCCLETDVPILVYEFLSNGNLFQFIHDENYEFPTFWSLRLQIATEIAGALAYLHFATSIPIYHRDVKSSNILLDEKFRAKLSDFGISKSVVGDQTHLSTLVKGTFGYLDPEYFQSSQFTEKSDVYSFGVVLVELLTGKKPVFSVGPGESRSLATMILEDDVLENLDDRVLDGSKVQHIKVANLAKRCLNLNGKLRPTMKEVATELEAIRSSP